MWRRLDCILQDHLKRGAVFFDLHATTPYRLDVFSASIRDGRGNTLIRRLFAAQSSIGQNGRQPLIKQPTVFLDLSASDRPVKLPDDAGLPDRPELELALLRQALEPLLEETRRLRDREVPPISRHIELSLNALINRENLLLAELVSQRESGSTEAGLDGRIKISEDKLLDLDHRLQSRRHELLQERQCSAGDIQHLGQTWVLPHPERDNPSIALLVSDPAIERLAIQAAIVRERLEGRVVENVEGQSRGFDLISRRAHPENPKAAIDVRFIKVRGRQNMGDVVLSAYEYKTAQRLGRDYWLYVVFHGATPDPSTRALRDPAGLDWQAMENVGHYRLRLNGHSL